MRDKLLFLVSDFIDKFHKDVREANLSSKNFHPDFFREMFLTYFSSSRKSSYIICMLLDQNDSRVIMELFDDMKNRSAIKTENDFDAMLDGDFERTFYGHDYNAEINLINHISNIIKDMK